MLPPSGLLELELRMDWKGTGYIPAIPLMDKPGKYTVRFALVFEVDGQPQYVMSPTQAVEMPEDGHLK